MPIIMNPFPFSEDECALVAPPAKKPRTGSVKSVNSGPGKPKEKTSGAPESAGTAPNALTRMLKRGKDAEGSGAAVAPSSSAAVAASAKEHVSTSVFA